MSVTALVRTCAAEWVRLRTVRTTWWFVATATVLMVGIGFLGGRESRGRPPTGDVAWAAAQSTAIPAQFALLAIVLIAVTSDYATGGIVPSLQWTPRRGVLLVARVLVPVAVATAVGALLALASASAARLSGGPALPLPADGVSVVGWVALVVALGTATAAGLGFLLRSTAGGLVTVFLLMLILPIMLGNLGFEWTTWIAERLPGTAAVFLLVGEGLVTSRQTAIVILLCWAGGALLLGGLRFLRDDANR